MVVAVMRVLILSFLFVLSTTYGCLLAQVKVSKDYTLQKTLKQDGLEYQFTVLDEDKRGVLHYDLDRTYYWYKAQKVMGTEGAASGMLLNGEFVAYHPNKQLAQKGKFCKGLKYGTWLYWNDKGEIIRTEKWRRGKEILPKVKEENSAEKERVKLWDRLKRPKDAESGKENKEKRASKLFAKKEKGEKEKDSEKDKKKETGKDQKKKSEKKQKK